MSNKKSLESHEIDLHTHSIYSDGEKSPAKILEACKALGISSVSVTDHDTDGGMSETTESARALKIQSIQGMEITAIHNKIEFHILALGYNYEHPAMQNYTNIFEREYKTRLYKIIRLIENDNKCYWQIDYNALNNKPGVVTRINIASSILNSGMSPQKFYSNYLDIGKKYCVEMKKISVRQAIEIIHKAGGKAVWAHPGFTLRYENNQNSLLSFAKEFAKLGIDGLEVFYRKHSMAETIDAFEAVEYLKLMSSAGSDYHWDEQSSPGQFNTYGLRFDQKQIVKDFSE